MDIQGNEIFVVYVARCGGAEFCVDELVELAHAATLCVASDQFLAGSGPSGSQQSPVRRFPGAPWSTHALAWANDGALGADDP